MWQNKMASYLLPVEETRGVTQKLEKKVSKELITEDGYCKKNLTLQSRNLMNIMTQQECF